MEELNELCETLMEKCACSWVRDQTIDIQKKYSDLVANVQGTSASFLFKYVIILFLLNVHKTHFTKNLTYRITLQNKLNFQEFYQL